MRDGNGKPTVKPTVEELRAEIKQTRAELGMTMQALAARADVKARALGQVEQTRQRVRVAASAAGERARALAGQATEKVKETAPLDLVEGGGVQVGRGVRPGPAPAVLLFAGVVAVVGVVLIIRGRRR